MHIYTCSDGILLLISTCVYMYYITTHTHKHTTHIIILSTAPDIFSQRACTQWLQCPHRTIWTRLRDQSHDVWESYSAQVMNVSSNMMPVARATCLGIVVRVWVALSTNWTEVAWERNCSRCSNLSLQPYLHVHALLSGSSPRCRSV